MVFIKSINLNSFTSVQFEISYSRVFIFNVVRLLWQISEQIIYANVVSLFLFI
jgi:hypothetical protein